MNDTETTGGKVMIEIKGLYKSYGENHVLKGFDMKLYEGENLVIMGKSGSGKSVMIKCLVGLEDYDDGTVMVMGKDIRRLSSDLRIFASAIASPPPCRTPSPRAMRRGSARPTVPPRRTSAPRQRQR